MDSIRVHGANKANKANKADKAHKTKTRLLTIKTK